jgi:hypothetical protein
MMLKCREEYCDNRLMQLKVCIWWNVEQRNTFQYFSLIKWLQGKNQKAIYNINPVPFYLTQNWLNKFYLKLWGSMIYERKQTVLQD